MEEKGLLREYLLKMIKEQNNILKQGKLDKLPKIIF